ncbi:MAG TPA: hypothetical protein VIL42_10745 [Sphingomicrobium sp.]|jgi:hypothetical protein
MKLLRDLFMGVGNEHWDIGRIGGALSVLAMFGGAGWNISLGLPIELGPTGFGGGLAAVLGGAAAWIYAKDRARAENTVAKAVSDCPPEPQPAAKARPAKARSRR